VIQSVLAWYVVVYLMPAVGVDLLESARAVAKFDVPAKLYQLFAGTH
jgi:hypothetical protein